MAKFDRSGREETIRILLHDRSWRNGPCSSLETSAVFSACLELALKGIEHAGLFAKDVFAVSPPQRFQQAVWRTKDIRIIKRRLDAISGVVITNPDGRALDVAGAGSCGGAPQYSRCVAI